MFGPVRNRRLLVCRVAVAATVALALLGAGCDRVAPPDRDADVRFARVASPERTSGALTIEVRTDESAARTRWGDDSTAGEYDVATVTVTDETTVIRAQGDGWVAAVAADVLEAEHIDVWFGPWVAESYPVQSQADVIAIID